MTLVDVEDYARLSKYNWREQKGPYSSYAHRSQTFKGLYDKDLNRPTKCKRIQVSMHRQILGLNTEDSRDVDHRDHEGLNNSKHNIRPCTRSQNKGNSKKRRGVKYKYKGVRQGLSENWSATMNGKHLGMYKTEVEAAQVYDKAAKDKYGEFAYLNFS